MVELGPGDSLGLSLCAFLSGVDTVYALDVVPFAAHEANARLLDELLLMFKIRAPIPGPDEFPRVRPALDSYVFPFGILGHERLDGALAGQRVDAIRTALANPSGGGTRGATFHYVVPWRRESVPAGAADLVLSQAVMQYVPDLDDAYACMHHWLKPGGWMSHAIDFKSHGTAPTWDGHWSYGPLAWRLLNLRQHYRLNRQPHSRHLQTIARNGFTCVTDRTTTAPPECPKPLRMPVSEADRRITGTLVQASKCHAKTDSPTPEK
jgi:hypothetical protein